MRKKSIFITETILITIALFCFIFAGIKINKDNIRFNLAYKKYINLFENYEKDIPQENLNIKKIEIIRQKISTISYTKRKEILEEKLDELTEYVNLRDQIDNYFDNNILKSNTSIKEVESLSKKVDELSVYKKSLLPKIENMKIQVSKIKDYENIILSLYSDNTYQSVREDVSRDNYNHAILMRSQILQKDIVAKQQPHLEKVNNYIVSKEKEMERKIKQSWKILDVPYISQNKNNVLNGCEVASLLMGLQYKGYLKDMDLATFATNVPKSTDPNQGFTYDIFGLNPTNVPHWIAPKPLADYGISTSGNKNIYDGTGLSLDALDAQIAAGNPVVIYLTSKFNTPKPFIEGAPKNIHVLLLTGYNSITSEQIITDPWTYDDGRTKWQAPKSTIEKIYNATGKRAVIIS